MSDVPAANPLTSLFPTEIYRAELVEPDTEFLFKHLEFACHKMAQEHTEGRAWSANNNYIGYTSYGTINNLRDYAPVFEDLFKIIDTHALKYATLVDMDLRGRSLVLQDSWINMLGPKGGHSSHLHPMSMLSGTVYISVPEGGSGIQFEDPRMPMMMHTLPRLPTARPDRQAGATFLPARGTVLLWESWLRHEVPQNPSQDVRISISFNYDIVLKPRSP